ncbi:MAG: hypothetical protein ACI9H6_000182 [Patiriisocius sp.]|jgi:hypothetical protein
MHTSLYKKITSGISGFLVVVLLVTSGIFTPINPHTAEVQKAEALFGGGGAVWVVGGNGTIQDTISAGANTVIAGLQQSTFAKEYLLDGIASGLAKLMLKSMTQSILTWINNGFQGSPAFVTDLKQFLIDEVDKTVGEFIYNDPSLNFLCSPFQLDVKIALATTYRQNAHEGLDAQCTLSGITDNVEGFLNGSFDEGGWQSWFEITQKTVNTPTGAYLAAEAEMYARIVDQQGNTIRELDWGEGFLSFKVCADTEAQTDCDITTPGRVIADQINSSLGAGQDALIAADEINEIIGALFAQLAEKAITGAHGLLGLGGGSSYTDYSFEGTASSSYLTALDEESTLSEDLEDPFAPALTELNANVALQNVIIANINAAESRLLAAQARHPLREVRDDQGEGTGVMVSSCPAILALEMPTEIEDIRRDAALAIIISDSSSTALSSLSTQFTEALTSSNANEIETLIDAYTQLDRNNQIISPLDNTNVQIFIDNDLREVITNFDALITSTLSSCEDRDR